MTPCRRTVLTGAAAVVSTALLAVDRPGTARAVAPRVEVGGTAPTARSVVQDIQRRLAARYGARSGFPPVTTDGVWTSRSHRVLIRALQLELGISDQVANGNFGPLTRATLRSSVGELAVGAADSTTWFVHLLQSALVVNSSWDGPVDGVYSVEQARHTVDAQRLFALPATGRTDFATWAALLASDGDTTRPAPGADGVATLTPHLANMLVDAGYTTVGRYLTDSPVPDALKKQLTEDELDAVFGAGLRLFPIFQEGGTDASYFSYERGRYSAGRAHEAATRFGLASDTVIYYAVDFDATEQELEQAVHPYFVGVHDRLSELGSRFDVGVYGGRAVCAAISAAHLATFSYIAGMATGWESNLGKPMPENWSFSQVATRIIGAETRRMEIDRNVMSGRDMGQSSRVPRT